MLLSKMTEEFLTFVLSNKKTEGFICVNEQELSEPLRNHMFGLAYELQVDSYIKNLRKYGSYGNRQIDFMIMPKAFSYFEEKENRLLTYKNEINYINNFGNNSTGVMIQQNSINSSQTMNLNQEINYEKAQEIVDNIKKYIDDICGSPEDQENINGIILEIEPLIKEKKRSELIKSSLGIIKDILIKVSGNVVTTGILHLMSQMNI